MNWRTKVSGRLAMIALLAGSMIGASGAAHAAPRKNESSTDVCVVRQLSDGKLITPIMFQDVPPMVPGRAIALRGLYISSANDAYPFDGSAVMELDGLVRLAITVHTSARRAEIGSVENVVSGETDVTFSGLLHHRSSGSAYPDSIWTLVPYDCSLVVVP